MVIKDKKRICKNRSGKRYIINIGITILALALLIPNSSAVTLDPTLKISIGSEVFNGASYPTVTLENSVQKAVIRTQTGGKWGVESVIKDWILKSAGRDLVSSFVDANSFRGPLSRATITINGENSKTVRLIYAHGSIVEYTINANSPVIKIKYEKYDVIATSNIVDRTNTGGATRVYGQGRWIRSIGGSYYECAYWDSYETTLGGCGIRYGPDPANAGSLNYKGHIIMAFGQTTSNGIGFGRVMPVYTGTKGGIRILKIFPTGGFEPYQATRLGQLTRPAHYGYIYLFKQGVDNAITQGLHIVDGLSLPAPSIAVISPNGGENLARGTTRTISWSSSSSSGAYVKIELLKAGVLNRVITSSTPNDGSFSWAILSTQTLGSDYKIRVRSTTNSAYTDTSNNNFVISTGITVTSPNGGENWTRGTIHTISWSSSGSPGAYVKIELLKAGVLNRVITSSTLNDGSQSWTIPSTQTLGSDYKVRITSTSYPAYVDVSNNYFRIK